MPDLIIATIDPKPGICEYATPVYVDSGDARRVAAILANLTGCRVRVEHVYEPAAQPTTATATATVAASLAVPNASSAPSATVAVPRSAAFPSKGQKVPGSAPERVLTRINAEPQRWFCADDFADLGLSRKRTAGVLYRLASEECKIKRGQRGRFRALPSANNSPPRPGPSLFDRDADVTERPSAGPRVLAFMQSHPDKWLKARDVTEGMGYDAAEHMAAIRASLTRLAGRGQIEKSREGAFRWQQTQPTREEADA